MQYKSSYQFYRNIENCCYYWLNICCKKNIWFIIAFISNSFSIHRELQKFFTLNQDNSIEFWKYPSWCNWSLHKVVDKETKSFNPSSLFPYKSSWDYSQKKEYDELFNTWKITFQASDLKEQHFLDLYDNDNNSIKPSYIKNNSWLKYFGHSNSLCARVMRAITNYVPIGEYKLRFFS